MVSKVLEKLINDKLVRHPENFGLFSDFHYGCRLFRCTANLMTVVIERISSFLNISAPTRAIALNISKACDGIWHIALLHNLKTNGVTGDNLSNYFLFSYWSNT